ncbi:hypothetical protein PHAVU_006G098300 [Phaseolus vulgaris]|uniref:Benzyl alcohol O-benzoyltransferase n=1 Tax=Phaseolus vulgaris TaxID=3885 RepID=V7BQ01_PHAVU|nr:hypothetical protein PHAVU_006G098300g [Phaseolus vulgaris]ESW19125.1 hypothetical protein PHAVU_006G098300g [Phaseolus vulgaris]
MTEKDPVEVIRQALSQTLVFYYPFAGRLREGPQRKLMVDCTGEGAMFMEGDADVTLAEFGDSLQPPFPCFDELLYDVPGSQQITDTPLLLVTRLKCGGFILVVRFNHTMFDGFGYQQFINAWAEIARGVTKPSIAPVWAMQIEADEDVRMMCIVNARGRFNPPLPDGYYGNAFAYLAAVTSAGKLCRNPFGYAVELINKVKGEMKEEYLQSVADLMVMKGRSLLFTTVRSCIVSYLARVNLRAVDFGWGKAVYGGVAQAGAGSFPGISYFCSAKNGKGEEGIIFSIFLPAEAMERFAKEFNHMLCNQNQPQSTL